MLRCRRVRPVLIELFPLLALNELNCARLVLRETQYVDALQQLFPLQVVEDRLQLDGYEAADLCIYRGADNEHQATSSLHCQLLEEIEAYRIGPMKVVPTSPLRGCWAATAHQKAAASVWKSLSCSSAPRRMR